MTAFELEPVNGRLTTSAGVHPVDIGIRQADAALVRNAGQGRMTGQT